MALAGAVVGLLYVVVPGGAVYPDGMRAALTGAIVVSVVLTAIKIALDL